MKRKKNVGKTMKPQSWLTSFFVYCIGKMEKEEWRHNSKDGRTRTSGRKE